MSCPLLQRFPPLSLHERQEMKKFKYGDESLNTWDNQLEELTIFSCKSTQPIELIVLMEKKASELANNLTFSSYTERLLFLDAFYKGYIAAHCFNFEEEALVLSLSPLSKALE